MLSLLFAFATRDDGWYWLSVLSCAQPQVAAKAEMLAVLDSPTEDGGAAEAAVGTAGAPAPAALPPASLLLASVGHHQPTYELDDDEDEEGDRYQPLHSNEDLDL